MKKIRLNENQLRSIIKESVKRVISEIKLEDRHFEKIQRLLYQEFGDDVELFNGAWSGYNEETGNNIGVWLLNYENSQTQPQQVIEFFKRLGYRLVNQGQELDDWYFNFADY